MRHDFQLAVMELRAVAMWQAINGQRWTRERRGHAFDRGPRKVVVAELVSARREPFLTSTFPRLLQVFPRTLYFGASRQSKPVVVWGLSHLDLAPAVR